MKRARLTEKDRIAIRGLVALGKTLRSKEIAKRYGVSRSLVQSISLNRR